MIKIDVEGGEYSALKGVRKTMGKYYPTIICEIHPSELKILGIEPENLFELLKGYKLFLFQKGKILEKSIKELSNLYEVKDKTRYGGLHNPIILAQPKEKIE